MKVKIDQDRHIVKEVFEQIESYNDNIDDFTIGYHNGEAYFETDSKDLYDWVKKTFVSKKKYIVMYDIEKKGSDCLFDRQATVWAYNDTEAEKLFLEQYESPKDVDDWRLNSIQDLFAEEAQ